MDNTIYNDFAGWIFDDCPIPAYTMLHYGNNKDARQVAEVFAYFYACDFQTAYNAVKKYKQLEVNRNIVKLTESDLKKIISASVKKVLQESANSYNKKRDRL